MRKQARIALIGQVGTGKSFLASQLARQLGGQVHAFGHEVYRVAEETIGRKIDKSNPSDRKLLTDVGTGWGRKGEGVDRDLEARLSQTWPYKRGYPEIWVDAFDRKLARVDETLPIILDDLRFPNELYYLLDAGFIPILVLCEEDTRTERLAQRGDSYARSVDDHESEQLATTMTKLGRVEMLVPVLWNDQGLSPKNCQWFMDFRSLVECLKNDKCYESLCAFSKRAWKRAIERVEKEHDLTT